MKNINEIMKQVVLISQFGLSLIMPTLICVLLCSYLTVNCSIGGWIYIPGFIIGLGSSFMTAYRFYVSKVKESKKGKKKPVGFNRHM